MTENERLGIEDEHMDKVSGRLDPWQDRCDLMKCKTCMWFVFKKGIRKGIGRCRKRAPTLGGYPVVYTDDWCGNHKIDENKV